MWDTPWVVGGKTPLSQKEGLGDAPPHALTAHNPINKRRTTMSDTALLTPEEAARFLNIKARTLEKWRQKGTGPAYHRLGARCVRYAKSALQAWLQGLSNAHGGATEQTANNDKE